MTDAQTEARAIARLEFTCPDCDPDVVEVNLGRYVRFTDHATALAAKDAELAAARENCETVCNSYADENQRLFDRAERAEAQLAEAKKALEPFARFATHIAEQKPGWDHDDFGFAGPLSETRLAMRDFREARRVYVGGEDA